ncbi:3,4-dihydroxy 2-butanone 4-phosphate synthase/GTP cyclohydrolase II [Polynucleobacter sphagniphilus]|jgi:3,4-dihydroxy 2-butanone 4-phosphate synthase/GTP cyclohydrolase II|uniref:3,4-dihydroxy-2-butanone 4-phosphate synthase n=1 Tax=Polynucleobacter sphagniphilus TaxID=1743169 RepID=A0AA43MBB6_9BURK|nr:bifunctional 3,4-dihydroxy-2-butanone-4-phosphate synthase/GTP cyclohydrolase II [Polynucleobacter sphagniphilus]MDH6153995.1 3,4-dihydroxy 2-butanone 4-phosphate synthase/GTP cyclohydrolase II [Polynucleobacter sphagniphilus]MDH6240265.1 3,4-dihydroxy 2-butanone 4-phosphate synthase/GTP cyclohydrolase II [Polynucleobacter sphagniphilus]MDH6248445.1 3,4-dihydroxy 2-butanone 4-phosphate synthase/GTP cyclohydrolase II [Polynucleobacter sphagniphilus]MDH6301924.1 3,4-dihydroxy 2-butanone 4-phos
MPNTLAPTEEIVAELRAGRMVILVDEEDRENEGDLVLAADHVTADAVNFMAKFGRGLICLTLTRERCQQLNLPLMVRDNGTSMGTNFTVSIEAASGVTTGISAADRAHTIKAAVAPHAKPNDLVQPGHIFPLMAQPGGVLIRSGHTEAGCDLAAMAGCSPTAVICEIMKDDGSMARLPDLLEFAQEHQLKIGSIADLIQYRSQHESIVVREGEREFATPWGTFKGIVYRDTPSSSIHIALVQGTPSEAKETLVRVHEPVTVLDFLDAQISTHSWPLGSALEQIAASPAGVAVLLNASGIGAPHENDWLAQFQKLNQSQDEPSNKPLARKTDFRSYGIGAQILKDIGVGKMRLLANPSPTPSLSGYKLEVTGYAPFSASALHQETNL